VQGMSETQISKAKGICTDKVTIAPQLASMNQPKNSPHVYTAFSSTSFLTSRHQWVLHRGCTTHVIGLRDSFTTCKPIPKVNTGFILPIIQRSMRLVEVM